ncbi:MAG TPA: hypothetical protein VF794_19285 [Archangium sp.]|jgi:hypothetical protein|uniref:hypothetical protein n=1 Tax=Archangium sp. TaxID=1872627 RepID=UPI002EDB90FA
MTQERKDAPSQDVVKKIHETVEELERLIAGAEGPARSGEDPREEAFWSSLQRFEEELSAKAGLLSELIELVLPEVALTAKPIRSFDKVSSPERVRALETLFGTIPTRERTVAWLEVPAVVLLGGKTPADAFRGSPQDSGVILAHELYLLVDGRLASVESVGTWSVADERLVADTTIVRAREVRPDEVLREFDLMFLLVALRGLLHNKHPALEGRHVPDLAERQERFAALVTDLTEGMAEHLVRLRRVGDSV